MYNIIYMYSFFQHNINLNPDDLPKVPLIGDADMSTSAVILNSSAGTTASITTNASPLAHRRSNNGQPLMNHSPTNATPQKGIYKNQNNNQVEFNCHQSFSFIVFNNSLSPIRNRMTSILLKAFLVLN